MTSNLEFALAPERLDEGAPEEKAAFGLFTLRHGAAFLTEGFDSFINGYRKGPLVSAYYAAEWLAWNWWRLRWEPRSSAPGWDDAHVMTSIGEGYVWPNLTIWSDGIRTALISNASRNPEARPFRYVGANPIIVPATAFEGAVDAFIPQILARLAEEGVTGSNLARVWNDVSIERRDKDQARRRKLEAYLGLEPDTVEEDVLDTLVADDKTLGRSAVDEVAADAGQRQTSILHSNDFEALAQQGFQAEPKDGVSLPVHQRPSPEIPAWKVGARLAQDLREKEKLGDGVVSNALLAALFGVSVNSLNTTPSQIGPLAFSLRSPAQKTRLVLRSRYEAGRRFELARLLSDRLLSDNSPLLPATRSATYRQKAQRAFAAEFLSPFDVVKARCAGDYSSESQQDVAEHFEVSPLVIDTLLKNHGQIPRDDAQEFDLAG